MSVNFDRVARRYASIERLVYGRALERARIAHLEEVADCPRVLIVGEGDGRFLGQLLRLARPESVDCVEPSARMLNLACRRIPGRNLSPVIRFHRCRLEDARLGNAGFDLIVTNFLLDMFCGRDLEQVIDILHHCSTRDSAWIVSDFRMPPGGFTTAWARLLLWTMYRFFRITAGLKTTRLESPEPILHRSGWRSCARHDEWHGFIRSTLYRRAIPDASF